MINLCLNPRETAVLVIDMQNGDCSPEGFAAKVLKSDVSSIVSMAEKMPNFLEKIRKMGVEIIWVVTDYQEKSVPENIKEAETLVHEGFPFPEISKKGTFNYEYYKVSPKNNEKEFEKTHPNAFQSVELQDYLKKKGFKNLIFVGVWTSRCVLASVIGSSTNGYRTFLLKDLTGNIKKLEFESEATYSIVNGSLGFVLDSKELLKLFDD